MQSFDEFSRLLLEEAKRFLEKAKGTEDPGQSAYLHAALTLGACALEAHVNAVCDDFLTRDDEVAPVLRPELMEIKLWRRGVRW
jgi:hypothetical protein